MSDFSAGAFDAYRRLLLSRPRATLALLLLVLAFFSYHAKDFALDASADSLLLENDRDLQLVREIEARYEDRELLIVTFSGRGDLFLVGSAQS